MTTKFKDVRDELALEYENVPEQRAFDKGWKAAIAHQKPRVDGLITALKTIDLHLRIPAAEYVPSIGDVFVIVDEALEAYEAGE